VGLLYKKETFKENNKEITKTDVTIFFKEDKEFKIENKVSFTLDGLCNEI
jgi:hypothetical protein